MMTKTVRTLDLWDTDCNPDFVQYAQEDEDDPAPGNCVHPIWIDRETWEHMGEPSTITVTIEIGDQQNDGTVFNTAVPGFSGVPVHGSTQLNKKCGRADCQISANHLHPEVRQAPAIDTVKRNH